MIQGIRLSGVRSIREFNLILDRHSWYNEWMKNRSGSTAGLEGVRYPTGVGVPYPLPWKDWSVVVTERHITFTPDNVAIRRVFSWDRGG
jgi:hypothetical protein